ncbi:MAG: hypothetical protein Q9208_004104 [Pyrenodesmia sp. 3 TL-2023]
MKSFIALATLTAAVVAQTPPGCNENSEGTFVIQPLNISSAPGQNDKRQVRNICGSTPIITLEDGVLTDQEGRTGGIVANSQFQFDELVQENSLYLDGFSICGNGSLAIAGSTIFYQCLSGTFYNLYQQSQGRQCNEIYINTIPCEANGSDPADTSSSVSASAPSTPETSAAAPATPVTPSTVNAPYPLPTGNGTAPGPTASGTGANTPTTSATTSPSAFVPGSGAATVIAGGKAVALVAAIGAFAMF